ALLLVDRGLPSAFRDARGGDLVIDAPAHVLCPGLASITPPRVGFAGRFRVQATIYVHPFLLLEHAGEPAAFFRQEATVLHVSLPVLEVDLLMRDIPVATDHDFAAATRQLFQVREEAFHEDEFRCLPMVAAGAGGQVDGDDGQAVVNQFNIAPFGIDLGHAQSLDDLVRLFAGVYAHAT